jgi:hypothetical protein
MTFPEILCPSAWSCEASHTPTAKGHISVFNRHETPVTVLISRDYTCNGFLLFIESRACGFGWVKSIMTSRQDSSPIGGEKRVQAEGRRSSSHGRKLNRSNKKRHKAAMNGGRTGDAPAVWWTGAFGTADRLNKRNSTDLQEML